MKFNFKQSNDNIVNKIIKNNKKKVHFSKNLNKTFTYVKSIEEEDQENKINELNIKKKKLYNEEINNYLIKEVLKLNPKYYFNIYEDDLEGSLFLFDKDDKVYVVFFHNGDLQFKIILLNIKLSDSFLDSIFKDRLNKFIKTFNNINEYFDLNVLSDKIK